MATKFEYTADLPGSPAALHALYMTEDYWVDRVAVTGGPDDELVEFTPADGGATVVVKQVIPDEKIPSAARKVVSGQLAIVRKTVYSAFDGESATGDAHAEALSGLGVIDGSGTAVSTGADQCQESVAGTVKVSVPLLGGKLEKLVVSYLHELFDNEYAHVATWLQRGQ